MKSFAINKIRNTVVASILMLVGASSAFAFDLPKDPFYLGIGLLKSEIKINQNNIVAINGLNQQSVIENDGVGLQLIAGLDLDEHMAIELGLSDMGAVTLDDGVTRQQFMSVLNMNLDTVFKHRISQSFETFAKLGIAFWEVSGDNLDDSVGGSGLHYGLGFNVNIYGTTDRVLKVLWEHHEFDQTLLEGAESISASLVFNF